MTIVKAPEAKSGSNSGKPGISDPGKIAVAAATHPAWFEGVPDVLSEAVDTYGLADTSDWEPMAEISRQTIFDGIEVFGDEAIFNGDVFAAPATVYVTLVYDPGSNDPVESSDRYPASVYFSIDRKRKAVEILRIEIDNSSFFE
jgi:hypothetical protein